MSKANKRASKTRSLLNVQTHKHPKLFVIGTMLAINVIIVTLAAVVAWLIDESFTSVLDAFVNGSMKWLLTPNAVLGVENPATFALAVFVLIVGLVLFSGMIIGLATNMIKDFLFKKEAHEGVLRLQNHIVVLNYNNKVPEFIADLVHVKSRAVNVVILTPTAQAYAEKHLLEAIKRLGGAHQTLNHLNIFVKTGDVLLEQNLNELAIEHAQTLVVMSDDEKTPAAADLEVLKVLLTLGNLNIPDTNMVVEIKTSATKEKINTLKATVERLRKHHIEPVCFDRRLGQMMAQAVIHPAIEDVYLSLFSFEGSEAYRCHNTNFETILKHHSHAIPVMREGEDVYVYTDSNATKDLRSDEVIDIPQMTLNLDTQQVLPRIILVGENRKLPYVLEAFKAFEALHQTTLSIDTWSFEQLPELCKDLMQEDDPITLLLLSKDDGPSDLVDAQIIHALIHLEVHLPHPNKQVIVELLDPRNDRLVKEFTIENTIISNKLVALMLSKIALFPETIRFYDRLLTIEPSMSTRDDDALELMPASKVLEGPFPRHFTSAKAWVKGCYHHSQNSRVPIGLLRGDHLLSLSGNLQASEPYIIEQDDWIVWFKV